MAKIETQKSKSTHNRAAVRDALKAIETNLPNPARAARARRKAEAAQRLLTTLKNGFAESKSGKRREVTATTHVRLVCKLNRMVHLDDEKCVEIRDILAERHNWKCVSQSILEYAKLTNTPLRGVALVFGLIKPEDNIADVATPLADSVEGASKGTRTRAKKSALERKTKVRTSSEESAAKSA